MWNTQSIFWSKRCRVTFGRRDQDDLRDFAHEHGLDSVCGSIEIAAHLEPETSFPPIDIYIVLDDDSYGQTKKLLRTNISDDREASLSLAFSHHDFVRRFTSLEDLDLTAKCTYPVIRFSLNGPGQNNPAVHVPKYKFDSATAADLTVTASAEAIRTSVWNSEFSVLEIQLTGKLQSHKLGFISSDDYNTIKIKEYKEVSGYPKEAFPGVVTVSREADVTYCCVTLYARKDVLKQIATLLSGMSKGDTVKFEVSVVAEGLPAAVGERKDFNVRSYEPVLLKSYA